MSNSLNFLNKPAATPKPAPYGPQPKPSTAAPKAAFLDRSNPWAVGGGTPTASAKTPARQPAPKTQTPAKTQQRAAIPSRGYNYTDASNTGATPQQRAREIDQAEMNAQATRQRKAQAQAQPAAPAPLQVAARPPAPMGMIQPAALTQPVAAAAQLAQAAAGPALQAAQGFVSPLMRRLNSWMAGSGQGGDPYLRQQQGGYPTTQPTPQAPADPFLAQQQRGFPTPQPTPQQEITDPYLRQQRGLTQRGLQYAPTPEGARAAANAAQPPAPNQVYLPVVSTAPAAPITPTNAYLLDGIQPGAQQPILTAPTPEGARAAANAAQQAQPAQPTQQPAPPKGEQPPPLFYGYTAPGPLTIERTAPLQGGQYAPRMTDRPLYTQYGQRAMLSDAQLATEYTQRQRDAAGSQANLAQDYRPWASLTDAEKYQRRFGVMPQGGQMTPNNASGVAAQAAANAQHDRLVAEYWKKYAPVLGWVDAPLWQYEATPRMGRETIQRGPSGQAARQAAPAAAPTTTGEEAQQIVPMPPGGIDNTLELQKINPAAFQSDTPTITESNVLTLAQRIAQRYMPGIDYRNMTRSQIQALLLDYTPSAAQELQYRHDLYYLTLLPASE